MINSYNWAILIAELEFVQTIISQFVQISWQKYKWFGNPVNIFVQHLPRIFRGKSEWNKFSSTCSIFIGKIYIHTYEYMLFIIWI